VSFHLPVTFVQAREQVVYTTGKRRNQFPAGSSADFFIWTGWMCDEMTKEAILAQSAARISPLPAI
jgi:hypothetical protein